MIARQRGLLARCSDHLPHIRTLLASHILNAETRIVDGTQRNLGRSDQAACPFECATQAAFHENDSLSRPAVDIALPRIHLATQGILVHRSMNLWQFSGCACKPSVLVAAEGRHGLRWYSKGEGVTFPPSMSSINPAIVHAGGFQVTLAGFHVS